MKQIIKNFNKQIKMTIFKVQNKTNNNFTISSFNKFLIIFIGLLFSCLFYLLIPLLYDKTWVQTNIESKLLNEFKIYLSTTSDISYRILPAPHFLVRDSKILIGDIKKQNELAEIKNLKIFINKNNFFDKEKINIKNIDINDANISLSKNDLQLIKQSKNKNFSNKKIKINNSNIFYKNNLGEVVSITTVDKINIFFDEEKLLNILTMNGKIFNSPFSFNFKNRDNSRKYREMEINFKSLNLNILDIVATKNKFFTTGENTISFLNSSINTQYENNGESIIFKSDNSRIDNIQTNYNGKLSVKPFDLELNVDLNNLKISELFNINPILIEFINSGLLFNKNISINTSVLMTSSSTTEFFQSAKVHFNIINGKINFNKTRFVNDDIGSLVLSNTDLFLKDNKLLLSSDVLLDIKDSDYLFSFLNTAKSSRKNFKKVLINLEYDFLLNQIEFNTVKIDNREVSSDLLSIIKDFNNNELNNFNKSRGLINKIFKNYEG